MKKFNLILLLSCLSFAFIFVGCGDDEETNQITITIEEPLDGATLTDCADVHIHVDFVASIENHEVEIILHPEGDTNDEIIKYDEHEHDKEITFEQEVDLCSYPAGTCFHLEVFACVDHDCVERAFAEAEFCIQ